MDVILCETKQDMGKTAAEKGAELIREAMYRRGEATIVVATGASQFEMYAHLTRLAGLDWTQITAFHLDEYVGLSESHPASFRRYLNERFVSRVPRPLRAFHAIRAEKDPEAECCRLGDLIRREQVDVAFVGVGENGHLAFNDPPADFDTTEPYLVVELDERCRLQQVGEGWFPGLEDVPARAISMSIRQIMAAKAIVCTVPDQRKAAAIQSVVEGPISPMTPASILRTHPNSYLLLDQDSASLLTRP